MPPMRLASAPSIPATTTTASASRSSSTEARWWSTRAKPRSANGRRRRRATASSGVRAPERTSARSWRRVGSSIEVVTILASVRVAYLGPAGTFTEEALLSQPDLAEAELVPLPSFPDVLRATADGGVDFGFVAMENSIEGTVRLVMDLLVFEHDLLIQREVVLPIRQNLLALPGLGLADVG